MSEYSNQKSKTGVIAIVVVVVLAIVIGGWYLGVYQPEQEAKEKARLEQIAQQQAEQRRLEQEAQKQARYDKLIEDGDAAFNQENWVSAQSLYSEASSLYSNQQYPKDQLVLVNAKLDEIAALEARKAAGVVETVSSATGRYYLIVSSSIDDDLAMDYASKLAKDGNSVKLVAHNANELPFYGVSLGDYATWDEATAASASFSNFEGGVWVLKY